MDYNDEDDMYHYYNGEDYMYYDYHDYDYDWMPSACENRPLHKFFERLKDETLQDGKRVYCGSL